MSVEQYYLFQDGCKIDMEQRAMSGVYELLKLVTDQIVVSKQPSAFRKE